MKKILMMVAALMVMTTVSTSQGARAEDINEECHKLCEAHGNDIKAYNKCMRGCLGIDGQHTE